MYRRLHHLNNIRLRSTTSIPSLTSCSPHRNSFSAIAVLQDGEASSHPARPRKTSASGTGKSSWKNAPKHASVVSSQQGRHNYGVKTARYIRWHERGEREKIKSLKVEGLLAIAQNSHLDTQDNLLTYLIEDILASEKGGEHYSNALQYILCAIPNSTQELNAKRIASIFVALVRANSQDETLLPPLPSDVIKMVVLSIAQLYQDNFQAQTPALRAIVHYLETLAPSEIAAMEINVLRFLMKVSYRLLNQKSEQHVLRLVQIFVRSEVIPSSLTTMDEEVPNDFRVLTVSLLIRTCFHHGWFTIGLNFLRRENLQLRGAESYYNEFINKLIMSLLPGLPHLCGKVIVSAIRNSPGLHISENVLAKFFTSAYEANDYTAAKEVYTVLQSFEVQSYTNYGIPPSPVATWLLQTASTSKYGRIFGKTLARHIIKSPSVITPYDRAIVIGACAKAGYCDEAEELWRYYMGRAGKELIAGHAGCMLHIVKSFIEIHLNVMRGASSLTGNGDAFAASFDAGSDISLGGHFPTDEAASPVDCIAKDNVVYQSSLVDEVEPYEQERAPDDVAALAIQVPEDPIQELGSFELTLANRLRAFAVEVYYAFKKAKEPLRYASHHDLNAMARAANELGFVRQSFSAIRAILTRKEIPDKHDVNVIISAMARRKPEDAELMLRKMVVEDLQIDGLLLSTVIHEALERGNVRLATRVFDLARGCLPDELPAAAMHRLLNSWLASHSCDGVAGGGASSTPVARKLSTRKEKDELRLFMTNALRLFEHCDTNGSLRRRYLRGCIAACLRAEDGALAFQMWGLKHARTGRKSEEAETVAKAIAHQIRDDVGSGRIGLSEAAKMLSELEGEK